MSYEVGLRKLLQNNSQQLYGRLLKIEEIARCLLSYTQGKFPYYTPHDFTHSLIVEDNLNWIIPDNVKNNMNNNEIFFLLVAAWLHDWGMIGKPEENAEEIREVHHLRTERNFNDMYDKLFLNEHEARIIGKICKGHTKINLHNNSFNDEIYGSNIRIRLRFLAAALRLADEFDITHNRTPEIVYYSLNPTEKAKEEFKRHLSITGIGQLDEKHKVYISAIARDPKGAKALRMVTEKIQKEVDNVKTILFRYGITIDYVDLRIQTKGFIDKPIGFEIDRKRIVEILIGEHLYGNPDAAIRELVDNSIDACKLRQLLEPKSKPKIILKKPSEDMLVIEDDGVGMDYPSAKKFLSLIGVSFYNSKELNDLLKDKKFDPISKFGIGIMSSFLIASGITIESRKKGSDPCRFTIEATEKGWKYEKGSLKNSGTKITLKLNKNGRKIDIKRSLEKYFLGTEIPLYYQDNKGKIRESESSWNFNKIKKQYIIPYLKARFAEEEKEVLPKVYPKSIINFETNDFKIIFATIQSSVYGAQLYLFNHGIFVGSFPLLDIGYDSIFCVNVKKDLFDLQISRETVIFNQRWYDFLKKVFDSVFHKLKSLYFPNNVRRYIHIIRELRKMHYGYFDMAKFEERPVIRSLIENVIFPIVTEKGIDFKTIDDLSKNDEITIYEIVTKNPFEEMETLSKLIKYDVKLLCDPYFTPQIKQKETLKEESLICLYLRKKGLKINVTNILNILLENCYVITKSNPEFIPNNVKFVKFKKNLRPLVVLPHKLNIKQKKYYFGSAYFGGILLFQSLLRSRLNEFSEIFNLEYLKSIELISEPIVYIDAEDAFIKKILNLKDSAITDITKEKIRRYFNYLLYFPLITRPLYFSVVYEAIDYLEKEIGELLEFDKTKSFPQRIGKIGKLYHAFVQSESSNFYIIRRQN